MYLTTRRIYSEASQIQRSMIHTCRWPGNRLSHYFALLLFKLGLNARLFHPRPVFNKHFAYQMIHLVLNAYCQQAIGIEHERISIAIPCLDRDPLRALHLSEYSWYGQTAFFVVRFTAAGGDF